MAETKDTEGPKEGEPGFDDAERARAAGIIQKNYRGHRARRELRGLGLDASTRWSELLKDAQYKHITKPRPPQNPGAEDDRPSSHGSPAHNHWKMAAYIAKRAGAEDEADSITDDTSNEVDASPDVTYQQNLSSKGKEEQLQRREKAKEARKKTAKMMDLQYFLEMVDQKRRYGSSLRKYHNYWKMQDTKQNFFYWLDYGEGKDVSLEGCSRTRLDTEQVRYLSREERMYYLVKVDKEGMLVWAKNGEKVWTKGELFKDSILGIVPVTDPTPKYQCNVKPGAGKSSDSDSDSDGDEKDGDIDNTAGDEGERYVNEDFHRAKGPAKIKYVNSAFIFNHLIRNSLKKGHKWIFVADTSFRLYIGYKQSGAFQHSSFLHGSRITAAGQIKVKRGQLRRLEPLSGHYRPPTENFRVFVESLKAEGVDMSRVSISKSYAVLVGVETYQRSIKKIKGAGGTVKHQKDKLFNPEKEKVKREEEEGKDTSESAEKERQYLEKMKLEETEAKDRSGGGVSKLLKRFTSKDGGVEDAKADETGRWVKGTGPEDGTLAAEGKR